MQQKNDEESFDIYFCSLFFKEKIALLLYGFNFKILLNVQESH